MWALRAGLTLAPASVVSVFLAPVAGRLADRIGGKDIFITGLTLFAAGMGWAAGIARPAPLWYHFLPALIVARVRMGCIFCPLSTVAMRALPPPLARAAA